MLKGHNAFEIVFLAGIIAGSVVRKFYTSGRRKIGAEKKRSDILDLVLIGAAGVGMVMPLLYLFTSWLDYAKYELPNWTGWVGTAVFAGAILMLWRSHADLGRNFSPTLQIRAEHLLVTSGVYSRIRHPMYTAHLLWAIGQGLLLSNWLAGWAFLVLSVPLYIVRIPKEERMMLEHFGEQYRQYMGRTGRLVPRVWK